MFYRCAKTLNIFKTFFANLGSEYTKSIPRSGTCSLLYPPLAGGLRLLSIVHILCRFHLSMCIWIVAVGVGGSVFKFGRPVADLDISVTDLAIPERLTQGLE
jgi:hypothetical protein